jgi:anti-sigma factor RsiW
VPDDNQPTGNSFSIRCADAVELVTEYLDDALNQTDVAAFEEHLAGCDGCTIFVDQIRMTIQLTNATNDKQLDIMPADFDSLLSQLQTQADQRQDPSA